MAKRAILAGLLVAGAFVLQPARGGDGGGNEVPPRQGGTGDGAALESPAPAAARAERAARPVVFGKRTETIGTFHGWSIWLGWTGSFSDTYIPYSESYSWNVVLAPEGVYVALTSAGANYSGVDVNAGTSNFVGALVSPNGDELTWSYFSSLLGVSIQYGISSAPFAFGPLSGLGAGFQTGPTFFHTGDRKLIHAIQYSAGYSVSYSILPIDLPISVSLDVKSDLIGKDVGFYPVIAWDVGAGVTGDNPLDHVLAELGRIAGTSGDGFHDAMRAHFARALLPVLLRMRTGSGTVPDDPDPADPASIGTYFSDFLADDSVGVPAGGPGGSVNAMIRAAQQWLDTGDTGKLPVVLETWRAVDLGAVAGATASVRAAADVAFEMGYRHGYDASGRTDTIYADDVVEVQAAFGKPCRVTVTAAEILGLLKGRATVAAGDLEGITVIFDNPPETYLSSQATETGVELTRGKATFEFVQATHAPFVMGVRIARSAATDDFALELARRIVREDGVAVAIAPGDLYVHRKSNVTVAARRISGGKMPPFTVTLAGAGVEGAAESAGTKAKFKGLTPTATGSILVTITAEGLPEVVRDLPVHDPWDVRAAPSKLRLKSIKAGVGKTVTVTARDRFTRQPFAGGEVRIEGCGVDATATADSTGVARIAGVEPTRTGTMVVTVSRDGAVLDRRPVIRVLE